MSHSIQSYVTSMKACTSILFSESDFSQTRRLMKSGESIIIPQGFTLVHSTRHRSCSLHEGKLGIPRPDPDRPMNTITGKQTFPHSLTHSLVDENPNMCAVVSCGRCVYVHVDVVESFTNLPPIPKDLEYDLSIQTLGRRGQLAR